MNNRITYKALYEKERIRQTLMKERYGEGEIINCSLRSDVRNCIYHKCETCGWNNDEHKRRVAKLREKYD